MDEVAPVGTLTESTSKSANLDGARRMALKHIEAFVLTFSDPQAFATAAASSAPAALAQVTERARIQEAGHLRCRCLSLMHIHAHLHVGLTYIYYHSNTIICFILQLKLHELRTVYADV